MQLLLKRREVIVYDLQMVILYAIPFDNFFKNRNNFRPLQGLKNPLNPIQFLT